MANNVLTGKVKFFKEKEAFGFIIPSDGSKEVFFHVSGLLDESQLPILKNDEVEYELANSNKGKKAINVWRTAFAN